MDALVVATRFGLYLDLTALFGAAAFALYPLRGPERQVLPLHPITLATALLGVILSAIGMLALAASLAGTGLFAADRETLAILLFETPAGKAMIARVAALAIAAGAAAMLRRRPHALAATATAAGGSALASLAWGGHGAIHEGATGWLHLAVDMAHLLAAGLWIGALLAFLWLAFRTRDASDARLQVVHRALAGFAGVGTIAVAVLAASGAGNVLLVVGLAGIAALPGTFYGQLLIAKLLLFALMLGLAARHRFRLVPALERALASGEPPHALAALRRSLAIETLLGFAILGLVAWLGTLDPSSAASGAQ